MAVKVDGHIWQHAFESGLLASGAVLAVALTGPSLGLHAWQIALGEVALGLVTALCMLKATDSMPLAAFWLASGIYAAGWTIAAWLLAVWSTITLGLMAAGFLALTPVGMFLWSSYRAEQERLAGRQKAIGTGLEQKAWQKRFEDVGLAGIVVGQSTATYSGRDIPLRLPMHGRITLTTLQNSVETLETAFNMKEGALRFSRGPKRGEVLMRISEKEVLEQLVPFPMDLMPRTINEPFPVGMMENGEYAMIRFREIAALIVGVRNAGKSNLLNVLIAQLSQCVDCVIWMIDLKGGRAAAPWLESWVADGTQQTRPVLDWVATTPEEAALMLKTFNAWIDLRSRNAGGKEKVVPSAAEPAIVLVVDEMAKVFGQGFGNKAGDGRVTNYQLAAMAKDAVVVGRSEAMDLILATQRGTVTMTGDGDLKSQLQLRIGLGTTTAADAMTVFPSDTQAQRRLVQLSKIPGAGVIEHEDELTPFKVFRIDADKGDIRKVAEWASRNTAAQPEKMLVTAGGDVYANRWNAEDRGQDLISQVARRSLPPDEDKTFEEITQGIEDEGLNPVRTRVREMVKESGLTGASPWQIREHLKVEGYEENSDAPPGRRLPARETINRWLIADAADGFFGVRNERTKYVRYYVAKPHLVRDEERGTGG
jgi:hypothetical protein